MARSIVFGPDSFTIVNSEDLEPALNVNKALYNESDGGWSKSREFRRAAFIPNSLIEKWLLEDGVNVLKPEGKEFLRRKLNDPDWRHLRTAPGTI